MFEAPEIEGTYTFDEELFRQLAPRCSAVRKEYDVKETFRDWRTEVLRLIITNVFAIVYDLDRY